LKNAQPLIAKAGRKGLVHKKAASRKVSRLSKRVSAVS
jgi:small subunit ribosomal protein S20